MSARRNEVVIIVRFPQEQYSPKEFTETGEATKVTTAVCRAFRSIMEGPMKGKSPNWCDISVGMHGMRPYPFWWREHTSPPQALDGIQSVSTQSQFSGMPLGKAIYSFMSGNGLKTVPVADLISALAAGGCGGINYAIKRHKTDSSFSPLRNISLAVGRHPRLEYDKTRQIVRFLDHDKPPRSKKRKAVFFFSNGDPVLADFSSRAEEEHSMTPERIREVMQHMGREGGKRGGKARAEKLTPEQRSESAKMAARTRWGRIKPQDK